MFSWFKRFSKQPAEISSPTAAPASTAAAPASTAVAPAGEATVYAEEGNTAVPVRFAQLSPLQCLFVLACMADAHDGKGVLTFRTPRKPLEALFAGATYEVVDGVGFDKVYLVDNQIRCALRYVGNYVFITLM
jgi:hypothetical protein